MWLYILNIITIPIYAFLIKDKKKFIILVAIQLFLILALRDVTLGVDMHNYSGGFGYISKMNFKELLSSLSPSGVSDLVWPYYYENGYTILNWIASHLGLGFHGLLVICASINISCVSYFIYRYSKIPWLSFVIFCAFGFYMSTFGILRQSLALSMVLLTYCFADKKKYVLTVIAFLLAISFHRAALLALPLIGILIFKNKKITRKNFFRLILISIPIMLFSGFIYNNVVVNIITFMGKGYMGHDLEANKKIFLYFGIALVMLFVYNFSKIKSKFDSVTCIALIFSIYFSIFGLYNENLSRALQFFSIFLLLLVPNIFEQYKDQKYTLVLELVTTVLFIIYMYSITKGSAIDPYVLYQGVIA